VLAAEHLLGFAGVDHARQLVETALEIVEHRFAAFGPFHQDAKVLGARPQRLAEVAILFETTAPLQQLLRGRLIFPEVRFRDALFYAGEFLRMACGVKDSSADRMRAGRGPDTCEAVRRVSP
jgi:hypothetical protein